MRFCFRRKERRINILPWFLWWSLQDLYFEVSLLLVVYYHVLDQIHIIGKPAVPSRTENNRYERSHIAPKSS